MLTKQQIIILSNSFLNTVGFFEGKNYMWSLQGPTVVFYSDSVVKPKVKRELTEIGASYIAP